jgi:drug/metabolite transporter (DMT)-like permease
MNSAATIAPSVSRRLAISAMLGSAACWGGATVMTKGALEAFDPFILLSIQLASSVCALWLAVLLTATRLRDPRRMVIVGSTGLLEPGLAYAIGVPGLALTTASNASVIAAMEPVFIFLGAWLLFSTRLTLVASAAVATAVTGVVLISLTDSADLGGGSALGDMLILLATIFAAAYVLASSRLADSMPAILLTALQQTFGLALSLILTVAAFLFGWQSLPDTITLPVMILAVSSGLIQYALAFWLYIIGLKGVPPGVAGMCLTTTPVFGVIGGFVFLGESFTIIQFLGMVLIIFSLFALLRFSPD